MTGRGRAATVVDVVVFKDLCMHCAIGTKGSARAGALEAQTRSLQDAQLATHGDGEGAPSHHAVPRPWPSQPGESAAPNTALHQGQDCVLSLLWQARECAHALLQAGAQRRATSKMACMLLWLTCPGRAWEQARRGRRSTRDCAYAAPQASAARSCRT